MEFFSGLDVGMDETAICVVDDKGKVALEVTVLTDPDAIKLALKPYLGRLRRALYEAASALLTRFKRKDKIKTWGLAIAKRTSHRKATVAVARKLAVIMRAMWVDGTFYCGDPDAAKADVSARAAAKSKKLLGAHA